MKNELAQIVGEQYVLPAEARSYVIDGLTPKAVVLPSSVEEITALIKLAAKNGWAITPAGFGTGLHLGNSPERLDLVISTIRLARVLDYEPADLTASVEAGCSLRDFNQVTETERQWIPFDLPQPEQATMGAISAMDDFSALRHAYGMPHDWVIGIQVVQADGTLIKAGGRVVKNVTGYDLNKLFVGSLGTLGLIVGLNLKLHPRPDAEATAAIFGSDMIQLGQYGQAIIGSELLPAALQVLNEQAARNIKLPVDQNVLLVRLLETQSAVNYQLKRLRDDSAQQKLQMLEFDDGTSARLWTTISDSQTPSETDLCLRIGVLPSHTARMIEICEQRLLETASEIHISAQVGTGSIRVRGKIICDSDARGAAAVKELKVLRAVCSDLGGSLIIEQAPVMIKKQMDVWSDVGSGIGLMRAIKSRFDPQRMFNPGRFVARI